MATAVPSVTAWGLGFALRRLHPPRSPHRAPWSPICKERNDAGVFQKGVLSDPGDRARGHPAPPPGRPPGPLGDTHRAGALGVSWQPHPGSPAAAAEGGGVGARSPPPARDGRFLEPVPPAPSGLFWLPTGELRRVKLGGITPPRVCAVLTGLHPGIGAWGGGGRHSADTSGNQDLGQVTKVRSTAISHVHSWPPIR